MKYWVGYRAWCSCISEPASKPNLSVSLLEIPGGTEHSASVLWNWFLPSHSLYLSLSPFHPALYFSPSWPSLFPLVSIRMLNDPFPTSPLPRNPDFLRTVFRHFGLIQKKSPFTIPSANGVLNEDFPPSFLRPTLAKKKKTPTFYCSDEKTGVNLA